MMLLGIASSLLVLAGTAASHNARLSPGHKLAHDNVHRVVKRSPAGGSCGPGVGSCDQGLCCSQNGVCGTKGEYCTSPGCQLAYGPSCDGNISPRGPSIEETPRPRFGNVPYGVDIVSCNDPGTMAITFDDGPYTYTNELLDLLAENKIPVTFFVTGMNGAKGPINDPSTGHPDTIRRMIADGHQVASHSWSHEDMEKISSQEKRDQIVKLEKALADILGFFPTYYRPPYTSCEGECYGLLNEYGYHVVNYNVDTKDWEVGINDAKANYNSGISKHGGAGIITLAHDIHKDTVRVLTQYMIDGASSAGYRMVTVGECLGDPSGNWYRDAKTGEPVGDNISGKVSGGKGGLEGKENVGPSGTTSVVNSKSTSQSSQTSTEGTQTTQATQTTQTGSKSTDDQAKEGEGDDDDETDRGSDSDDDSDSQSAAMATVASRWGLYAASAFVSGLVALL